MSPLKQRTKYKLFFSLMSNKKILFKKKKNQVHRGCTQGVVQSNFQTTMLDHF